MADLKLVAKDISKKYNNWIIKHFSYEFGTGQQYGITGPNGSGKSTLLQILSGFLTPTYGDVVLQVDDQRLQASDYGQKVSFAAPYVNLIEDLTLFEFIQFHKKHRIMMPDQSVSEVIDQLELSHVKDMLISHFSSGMKQRVKLGLSLLTESAIILLDEPSSFLDRKAISWFHGLLQNYTRDKVAIISTNSPEDLDLCNEILNVQDYKS